MNSGKIFAVIGALWAMTAVVFGAFGAHALRNRLDPTMLETVETGVRYQMYHALGLFAVAWATTQYTSAALRASGWLMFTGSVIFSGSLYVLAISGTRWWGVVTPIGGIAMILGWALLAWGVMRSR